MSCLQGEQLASLAASWRRLSSANCFSRPAADTDWPTIGSFLQACSAAPSTGLARKPHGERGVCKGMYAEISDGWIGPAVPRAMDPRLHSSNKGFFFLF